VTVTNKKSFTHIKKQDQVMLIAGKDKGKVGKVLKVLLKTEQVIVEKANIMKKHQRAKRMGQKGGIVEIEAPIHVSNVVLICNRCKKPSKVTYNYIEDKARKVRVCRSCGEIIEKGAE
jgi:large subunit ribosomal protein L24